MWLRDTGLNELPQIQPVILLSLSLLAYDLLLWLFNIVLVLLISPLLLLNIVPKPLDPTVLQVNITLMLVLVFYFTLINGLIGNFILATIRWRRN